LRALLGVPAVALTDGQRLLGWDGVGQAHTAEAVDDAAVVTRTGRPRMREGLRCTDPSCPIRGGIVVPLMVEDRVVGTLAAYGPVPGAGLVRATQEVATWVGTQLALGELDASRAQLAEAELRALRAQISPHFIYNALNTVAAYVRTDPQRARELLTDFADFTRYSFRRHGEFTTLAEELRSVDQYLALERARFSDRLAVTLQTAPEVLPVVVPYLCLQPLVENAVRHGLQSRQGPGHLAILAQDAGSDAVITVEDDGVGADPEQVRRTLAGDPDGESVGLGNVDARLRQVFGDDYGLVVETALGAGTRIMVRVPKFAPGVHAETPPAQGIRLGVSPIDATVRP
jgi:two-component system LytT family sensor kinase